ncbi:hypothetical protein ACFVZH_37305 [Streptomyces sp. NPDC059534]|uniref:hypothetical protein n=1 Tax=Streptomyces sp. NPDC059534 TaxID=3346859 RepID=UPI0036D05E3A
MKITYIHLGPGPETLRFESEFTVQAAYAAIGMNTVAGFLPELFTLDTRGECLRTPGGESLRVIALTGGSGNVLSALAFTGGC